MKHSSQSLDTTSSRLVVLATFTSDVDAHIAHGVLATNGIPSVINNELSSDIYPVTLVAWGELKLLVFEHDVEMARKLLRDNE